MNTLNKLYPGRPAGASTPSPRPSRRPNTPLPVRFANVDQILVAARSTEEIPAAIRQITELLRERHRIRAGRAGRFQHPRHDRDDQDPVVHDRA